jgi:DNA-binding XRE family transcriptional regulator/mannose-6-phosphate isomerase-like protein (cupin superfamily)
VAERASARSSLSVVDDDVPRRLRAERERRGISLRELARRLGISPSAISQIETGRARPSVATLWAIVTELGMSLDDLFAHDGDRRQAGAAAAAPAAAEAPPAPAPASLPVVTAATREALQLATGVRWERMTADADPDVDFIWVVYDVGGSSSPEDSFIRHAGREYGLVLSGRLEVTVGFEARVLGPGDSISFESTTPHRLRNAGDEPVTGVWVVVGRRSDARADPGAAPPPPPQP